MQIFPCPFCGPREEHEFLFAAEAGKVRPEPAAKVSDEEWAAYLYHNDAPKGIAREIWYHQTCGTYFLMTRDTVSRDVEGSEFLPGAGA